MRLSSLAVAVVPLFLLAAGCATPGPEGPAGTPADQTVRTEGTAEAEEVAVANQDEVARPEAVAPAAEPEPAATGVAAQPSKKEAAARDGLVRDKTWLHAIGSDGDQSGSIMGGRGEGVRVGTIGGLGKSGPSGEVRMAAGKMGSKVSLKRGDARRRPRHPDPRPAPMVIVGATDEPNREAYDPIEESPFQSPDDKPLSTFSIDVDTASYSNVRRILREGRMPPKSAVRIEELVNYFPYDYETPGGHTPFATHADVTTCPWNPKHRLVRVGLKGRVLDAEDRPSANLVFLLDVSGSMNSHAKLPLLKQAFGMLVNTLREDDRVSIVVYAGAAGLVLPPTSGADKPRIMEALGKLRAGGSTNGAGGIQLAYQIAREQFVKGGVNRVMLATDGDFNVGTSSKGALVELVTKEAESGVFLTVMGFGRGNLQDATMEAISGKGNGTYAYIDSAREARKVLVEQVGSTLMTIAKDVKIQVEFNPTHVAAYRLIGYENRRLAARDFNDDKKDAGEIGAGHTVTAFYEIVPAGTPVPGPSVDPLKYQTARKASAGSDSRELLTLKLRYKQPEGSTSKLISVPVIDKGDRLHHSDPELRFAAAVATFGMLLRGSEHADGASWDLVLELAEEARGADAQGHRAEFVELVRTADRLRSAP